MALYPTRLLKDLIKTQFKDQKTACQHFGLHESSFSRVMREQRTVPIAMLTAIHKKIDRSFNELWTDVPKPQSNGK